jgi:undecaprenyl pyrophosphate phosphatase UppP
LFFYAPSSTQSDDGQDVAERKKAFLLCVAAVPAVMAGVLLEDLVTSTLRGSSLVAGTLVVFGLLLFMG